LSKAIDQQPIVV
jgi:hypothetical protein